MGDSEFDSGFKFVAFEVLIGCSGRENKMPVEDERESRVW